MRSATIICAALLLLSACGARPTRSVSPHAEASCPLDLGRKHARRIGPTQRSVCADVCRNGDQGACVTYAIALEEGRGGAKNLAEARRVSEALCERGYGPACTHLAIIGRKDDEPADLALVKKACALNDPGGCIHLGWLYEHGKGGLETNVLRASALYQKSCDMGEPIGCVDAAWLYDVDGPLEPKDPARAIVVYTKACDAGAAVGCNNLAHHLMEGTATPADPKRALALYERACADDYMLACMNLAAELSDGAHTGKDLARAKQLWKLACDEGHDEACAEL